MFSTVSNNRVGERTGQWHSPYSNLVGVQYVSQYIREAYEHKERKGHPQIA